MVLKSSIAACLFSSVAITQALPSGFPPGHMDKRHTPDPPTLVAEAAKLPAEQQIIMCIWNYIVTAPENEDDQLSYKDLIDGCKVAVVKSAIPLVAPAPASEQSPEEPSQSDPKPAGALAKPSPQPKPVSDPSPDTDPKPAGALANPSPQPKPVSDPSPDTDPKPAGALANPSPQPKPAAMSVPEKLTSPEGDSAPGANLSPKSEGIMDKAKDRIPKDDKGPIDKGNN